ncbi:hypothetical protein SCHPADRAFT_39640 [Schizopora paradoxa]|uniref:Uncharacterized protein n=1 Tax=Schizopora paradoxa TaxID=27342 RepID=A0A0H2S648_9AGAM|nr:hypothetical protein SCHPADRAFT_39640 [Schizopora paradoxa]
MTTNTDLKIFGTKDSQQWPKNPTLLNHAIACAGDEESADFRSMWSSRISVETQAYRFQLLDAFIEEPFRFNDEVIETKEELFTHPDNGLLYQTLVKRIRAVATGDSDSALEEGEIILVAIVGEDLKETFKAIEAYFRTKEHFNPSGVIGVVVYSGEVRYEFYKHKLDENSKGGFRMDAKMWWNVRLSINSFVRSRLQIERHRSGEKQVEKIVSEVKAIVEQVEIPKSKFYLGRYVEVWDSNKITNYTRESDVDIVLRDRLAQRNMGSKSRET